MAISRHFSRSFELKSGADVTPHVAFAGPGEQDGAPAAQRAALPPTTILPMVPLICVLLDFGSTVQPPLSIIRSFHRIKIPCTNGTCKHVDDLADPNLYRPLATSAVRSHFRYCVDDDSIKAFHWTSALFYGSG